MDGIDALQNLAIGDPWRVNHAFGYSSSKTERNERNKPTAGQSTEYRSMVLRSLTDRFQTFRSSVTLSFDFFPQFAQGPASRGSVLKAVSSRRSRVSPGSNTESTSSIYHDSSLWCYFIVSLSHVLQRQVRVACHHRDLFRLCIYLTV